MNASPKYHRKVFISPNTNSTGYVSCFYDEDLKYHDYRFFIRIADCHRSFTAIKRPSNKRGKVSLINNLLSVIAGERKSFTYHNGSHTYRIHTRKDPKGIQLLLITKKIKRLEREYNLVTLHDGFSPEVSEDWRNKMSCIAKELEDFKQFLIAQTPSK